MPRLSVPLRESVTGVTTVTAFPCDHLLAIAERVRRLAPSRRDPERFHLDKSDIAAELRRLAREIAA